MEFIIAVLEMSCLFFICNFFWLQILWVLRKIYDRSFWSDSNKGKHSSSLCTTTSKLQLKYRRTITREHEKWSWMEVWQLRNWRNHIHPDWSEGCGGRTSWPHTHVDKNSRGIYWKWGVPDPHQALQPRIWVLGGQVSKTCGGENQQGLSWWRMLPGS